MQINKGNIKNQVNIFGDNYGNFYFTIAGEKRVIPKDLTALPFVDEREIIGRRHDLANVEKLLLKSDKLVLVNGLGGIGKTTLAMFFIEQLRSKFHHVAWVDVENNIQEALVNEVELLENLGLRETIKGIENEPDFLEKSFGLITNQLRQLEGTTEKPYNLLIIDNGGTDLEHTTIVRKLAMRPNWKILITSRETLKGYDIYHLDLLSPDEAKALFELHYTYENDEQLISEIVELVEYHTLVVEVVAMVGQERRLTLGQILDLLKKKGLNILDGQKGEPFIQFMRNYNQREQKVFAFLLSIFDELEMSDYERWIMTQFSVLPATFIPFKDEFGENIKDYLLIKELEEHQKLSLGINQIVKKGWLNHDTKNDSFKMHQVLQELLRYKLNPDTEKCTALIKSLDNRLHYQKVDVQRNFISTAKNILKHIHGESLGLASLYDNLSVVLLRVYLFQESLDYQFQALAIREKQLPPNHPDLAESYNGISLAYQEMGHYEKALPYQEKDLEITLQHFPELSHEVGTTYNNLSLIYRKINMMEKAFEYNQKAIDVALKINDDDLNITVYNNMGNLYYEKSDFEKSTLLYEKSLRIRIEVDADILWITGGKYNLATSYLEIGKVQEALDLLDNVYEIEMKIIPNSPSIGQIFYGYGMCYFKLANYDKALKMFEQSKQILLNHFEKDNIQVQRVNNWIKKILMKKNI